MKEPQDFERYEAADGTELTVTVPEGAIDCKPQSPIMRVLKKPGDALSSAFKTLKGRDLETLVEEFSSEVTLIIEGLSEDQDKLAQENALLQRRVDLLEKRVKELEKPAPAKKRDWIQRLSWLAGLCLACMALLTLAKILWGK